MEVRTRLIGALRYSIRILHGQVENVLTRPAYRVTMQDDVDRVENRVSTGNQRCDGFARQRDGNRTEVRKPRPILGAIDQQGRGQNINDGDTGATRRVFAAMVWCWTTSKKGTRTPRTR